MRHAPKDKILERERAEAIAARADGFEGPLAVKVEEKRQAPPRLHDLPSLQKLCGSRFGWSAEKTLAVAQELYDGEGKKAITYPRAETRYLPESLAPDIPRIVAGLQAGQTFREIPVPDRPIVRRGKSGHFWDKGLEGASHHAVIPNANTVGDLPRIWPRLSADERRLFVLIARSYLAALMPDFRYRQTTATLDVGGAPFRAVGRQPIELGWKAAFGRGGRGRGRGGEGSSAAAAPGRRSGAAARAQGGGEGDQAAAPLQRGHPGRGDAERLALRRGPGAAGAAEGSQGHRHAGDPRRDHQGAQAPGLPGRPGQAHRAHRARPGALRRAGAGRPGAGGPGRDGAAGVPAGRGPRGQAGDGSGDRRRLRPGRAHHRAPGGERCGAAAAGGRRGGGDPARHRPAARRRPAAQPGDAEVRRGPCGAAEGQAAVRLHQVGRGLPRLPRPACAEAGRVPRAPAMVRHASRAPRSGSSRSGSRRSGAPRCRRRPRRASGASPPGSTRTGARPAGSPPKVKAGPAGPVASRGLPRGPRTRRELLSPRRWARR